MKSSSFQVAKDAKSFVVCLNGVLDVRWEPYLHKIAHDFVQRVLRISPKFGQREKVEIPKTTKSGNLEFEFEFRNDVRFRLYMLTEYLTLDFEASSFRRNAYTWNYQASDLKPSQRKSKFMKKVFRSNRFAVG